MGAPRGEALGIDVGGLSFKAVRVRLAEDEAPEVVARARRGVGEGEHRPEGAAETLGALVEELDPGGGLRVGVAVPGAVRARDGVVTTAANFPRWSDFDVGGALRSLTARRVSVGNDANLFAFAEAVGGAARGAESCSRSPSAPVSAAAWSSAGALPR
ncbi:MAG: ROK family protein [Planctomycetota bacterium]